MNPRRTRETAPRRRIGSRCALALALALPLALPALCCLSTVARAQSTPTASRAGDLQLGGGFTIGRSTYNFTRSTLTGGTVYATFDLRDHWGFEADFHQTRPTSDSTVYERTYEIGPRLYLTRGRLAPYAKVLLGRGVYNFSGSIANIAYNLYTVGGGADYELTRTLTLRADYELQTWLGFPLGNLHPSLLTLGIAYHFHK